MLCTILMLSSPVQADYARFDAAPLLRHPEAKISLKGDWLFAWGTHLTPSEAVAAYTANELSTLTVPSEWSHAVPDEAENPYKHGIATYVAALSLPEVPRSDLTLHIGVVHDAYRAVWVPLTAPHTAREIALEGNLAGPSLAANRELNHPLPFSGEGLLVLHVRKDMFSWGGISLAPFVAFKRTADITNYHHFLFAGLMTGMLLLIILRNMMLYLSALRDVAAGVLAIISLMVIIRLIAVENLIEILFGPQWHGWRMRLEVACVPILATWTLFMFEVLFPRTMHPMLRQPLHVAAHLIGLTAFIVPLEMVPQVLTIAQVITLATFIPGAVRIYDALHRKDGEGYLLSFSAAICLAAGVNDIYASHSDSYNLYLIPISVVFLVMVLSHIIGNRAAVAIARTELLEQEKEQLARDRNDAVYLSRHDHLTGLLNRQSFDHYWEECWLEALQNSQPLTVVLFDIDHFKSVNDTFGHPVGDLVLKALADRLTDFNLRKTDRLCRYGGEEFALILPHCTHEEGLALSERLRESIAAQPLHTNPEISITCSFGVASTNRTFTKAPETLLSDADTALYRAKAMGRNCVKSHKPQQVAA